MTSSYTIVGYVYKADTYCPKCIVEEVLKYNTHIYSTRLDYLTTEHDLTTIAELLNIDRYDEHTYDSDDFPKVEFADSAAENESTCCIHHERLVDE